VQIFFSIFCKQKGGKKQKQKQKKGWMENSLQGGIKQIRGANPTIAAFTTSSFYSSFY
jgi:hypothetical protein